MSDPKQARSLIEAAARDITTVRLMTSNPDFPDENFGFNVQQAAEKLFKAWIALLGEVYPLSHDLDLLLNGLIGRDPAAARFRGLAAYTPFAVEFRYTGDEVAPPAIDRAEALRHLEHLIDLVGRRLVERQVDGV